MKKILAIGLMTLSCTSVFAAEYCYQLSKDGKMWSRTAELLCVKDSEKANLSTITLKINEVGQSRVVAQFKMNLLLAAKCIDCNLNLYGIANPTNSIFNDLTIKFDGKRNFDTQKVSEAGSISIGKNKFFYRSL